MPIVSIPFVGAAYKSQSLVLDAQRCVNLFPELGGPASKVPVMLRGTPGLKLWVTLGVSGAGRGLFATSTGRLFAVVLDQLLEISTVAVVTVRATLSTSFGRVSFADNGIELMIVDGSKGYIFTLASNAFAIITDPDFPAGAPVVTFQDGYFIVPKPNTGEFYISDLLSGSSWNALDFGNAEGNPDVLISLISNGRDLWLMGESSFEVWYNSGNPDFPFERVQGTLTEIGCAAKHSVTKMRGSTFWLGGSKEGFGIVFMSQGFQAVRISTHAIEQAIATYGSINDAVGFCYQQEGHWIYQLNFPTGAASWCFDLSTQMWFEKAYRDPSSGEQGMHRAFDHAFFDGKNLVIDYANDRIYELDLATYTDNGDTIARIRSCPHIHDRRQRLIFWSLELDLEAGIGLVTGQGEDPQVMLEISNDGARSWGNELWRSMGRLGEFRKRVLWNRLGRSRDRVFRITISDPVKVAILGAVANVEVEPG
jgi:hypothetical protein